ncbi:hypothetical protein OG453_23625 [Streptomyces sp. NBC_01381]|uniref:hypothetical protein n=1 Tax=Streptomyces sp. NBC_01381 TaxID=2903845 RepID=UPI00225B89A7|nr:hypothetical protein [Streptomyces sp. NBC_01381]MCX4669637.1 hypothetical protein [Streptomyces sp. NBC_01381]
MTEPARIRPVPDNPASTEAEAPRSITASGWQDILTTAAGSSPEVAASTTIAYIAHEAAETARAYIGQKGLTDRARIKAQSGAQPGGESGNQPEG